MFISQIKCFSCLIIIIHLLGTSNGYWWNTLCDHSSCGHIRNISYPFRLKDDPKYCGNHNYELACEENITSIYFNSHKYLVHTINYSNNTIRLITDGVIKNDTCSFPTYSLSLGDFTPGRYPYRINYNYNYNYCRGITFMSCPYPVNNSLLLETTHCFNESRRRHAYIKFGNLSGSDVMDLCTIDLMAMTSLPVLDENTTVSLSFIHSSLLYGFELSWFGAFCDAYGSYHSSCWYDEERCACGYRGIQIPWFAFRIISLFFFCVVALNLALKVVIGMPCMLGLLIYKLRRRHLSAFDIIEVFLQSNNNLMPIRYSYSNIKKITRSFREKLGQGGYGSVYKGKLRSGHDVAVKVINKPKANGQDFINEVAIVGRIHHVNVVKLVGFCAERSKRALVYDFMPNGSLEKYILGEQTTNLLSWERKHEIAIGVARGIEYLHKGCDIHILHFDIKPHNILLDENFTPKISDFGLAKFYATDNNMVSLTAARGTIGYVAPELINRSIGEVSHKADVYSFGMLLIEIVGLKRDTPTDDEKSSRYFPYWIYDRFNKGKDIETGDDEDKDNEFARKVKRKMTIIGLWCIQMSPVDRPSMSEVLKMLEGENENLQIPPQPSQSPQIGCFGDLTTRTESTDSVALLVRDTSNEYI